MNYVELDLDHTNLFCPITGEQICGDNIMHEKASSLMGFWINEVLNEPTINDKKLLSAWKNLVKETEKNGDVVDAATLKKMLRDYKHPNAVVFEIYDSSLLGDGGWFVLDLGIEVKEKGLK